VDSVTDALDSAGERLTGVQTIHGATTQVTQIGLPADVDDLCSGSRAI